MQDNVSMDITFPPMTNSYQEKTVWNPAKKEGLCRMPLAPGPLDEGADDVPTQDKINNLLQAAEAKPLFAEHEGENAEKNAQVPKT